MEIKNKFKFLTFPRHTIIKKNLSSDKVLFFDKVARVYRAAKKAKRREKLHLINYFFCKILLSATI